MNNKYSPEFQMAADMVKRLKTKPNQDELLNLYAWYKQVTVGDVNTERPGFFDLEGKAKWDAWSKVKGATLYDAQVNYINIVNNVIKKYGINNKN